MWVSLLVLLVCLGLVTSAPTVAERPAGNALAEEASQMGDLYSDLESALGFNSTSDEEADYEMLSALFEDKLEDVANRTDSLGEDSTQNDSPLVERAALQESTASEDNSSSEKGTASVKTPTVSAVEPSSSSPSSSSAGAVYEYTYDDYDYAANYADFVEPTAFPFAMFSDTDPRGPAKGDVLPSSCAWAVVQCCENPDKMGSRVSCFSHVGCYGSWFQDFCTSELKKLVFKSVFQSFKFNP